MKMFEQEINEGDLVRRIFSNLIGIVIEKKIWEGPQKGSSYYIHYMDSHCYWEIREAIELISPLKK